VSKLINVKPVNPIEAQNILMLDYAHAQMESMTQVMDHAHHVTLNVKLVLMLPAFVFNVLLTETTTHLTVLV